jgi:mitochondrial fission protein ELM1
MKRVVWIISEGSPGHISQSEGLVAALARQIDLESTIIETRPKLNGFARRLCRLLMGNRGLPDPFIKRWLRCVPPTSKPDLIVTSGGKAVFAARSLAVRTGAPLVFIGERKPYPSEWFHTVFTPSPFETGRNDVTLELIPTSISREDVIRAADAWHGKHAGPLWTMILGGASESHRFTDADWSALASAMNELASKHGIRWLISTSRRTGAHVEAIVRGIIDPAAVVDAIWWSVKPEKRLLELLGAAERVFVTQDSITMITEAVASGLPTEVVRPTDVVFTSTSFLPSYLGRLEASGWIRRLMISCLATADFTLPSPVPTASVPDIASKLLDRLPGF